MLDDQRRPRDLSTGGEDVFIALYDELGPRLYRAAWALTGSRQDAEDAVHEVFANLLSARGSLEGVRNLNAYLFSSVRREAARISARGRRR